MILMISLLALCVCGLVVWIVMKMSELDERQENLDKYSVYLDERANKLAIWENQLNERARNETDIKSEKDN